jgi:hypothetical protein
LPTFLKRDALHFEHSVRFSAVGPLNSIHPCGQAWINSYARPSCRSIFDAAYSIEGRELIAGKTLLLRSVNNSDMSALLAPWIRRQLRISRVALRVDSCALAKSGVVALSSRKA